MIGPGTIDLALRIANAAIELGGRIDTIMTNELLSESLPFKLPETPLDYASHRSAMIKFFKKQEGSQTGVLQDDDELKALWQNYNSTNDDDDRANYATALIDRWAILTGNQILQIGVRKKPISSQVMIAHYQVGSTKAGHQRSFVIDIALATADVALEFVASDPALITKNKQAQAAIGSFLTHFTKGDLEDLSYKQLFQQTLRSVINAAIENKQIAENIQGLNLFLEALANAQEKNPKFVAELVAGDAFGQLLQSVVLTTGENMDQFTDKKIVIEIVGGILLDAGADQTFKKLIAWDKQALATLSQVAIANVAQSRQLMTKVDGTALWQGVVKSVATEVGKSAEAQKLFSKEAIGSLTQVAMKAVAEDQSLLAGGFVKRMVATMAASLSTAPLKSLLSEGNLNLIAGAALDAAGEHIELLIQDDQLLSAVLSTVMKEGAKGFKDGFNLDFATNLAVSTIATVGENASAIDVPDQYAAIIGTTLKELSQGDLKKNLRKGDLLEIFKQTIQITAANPGLVTLFGNGKIPASVIRSIANILASDPTQLLRGKVLITLIPDILNAVTMRAKAFEKVTSGRNTELSKLLEESLKIIQGEVGVRVGAANIGEILVQIVLEWGQDKFQVSALEPNFKSRIERIIAKVNA